MSLDRRAFLKSSACVSGGLIIALHLPGCSKPGRTSGEPKTVAANAWLRIGTDNTITFLCDRSEMGQGVYTALPTLIAEELGVDLGRIRIDFAPAGDAYKNDLLGTQITGGSTSVRDAWPKLRRAGAQARTMLISAAAREWGIRAAVCRVENGFVVSPTGKRASFGACAEAAARLPVPNDVKLTDPGNFRLIGTSVRRLDTPLKVDGSARYGIDVRLPEMLYAALAQPPALGGKAASFDDSKARALPGVKAVVQTSSGIAVVATSWWQALKARDALAKLRRAGAQARTMLISAAAREWGIRAAVCRVENGFVVSPTGKRASFGACAEAAARLPVPNDVKLTDPGNFRLIGTSVRRLDTPLKVDGSARYGIDVRLPEMLYAALAQPPALGGKAASFDDSKARALPGVKAVVQTSSGIAVVATSWWQALKARDVLAIRWDDGANGALNDGVILRGLERATGTAQSARRDGDADAAIKSAARVVKAEYQLPLLAHATLEPQNCTADVRAEGCDIYVPTQIQQVAQQAAASAAGLKPEQVRVHTTFLGGGFGRRLDVDFVPAAVEASKAVGKPVKLLWTREDDTTHDVYRPPAFDTAIGAFDKSGKLIAWKLRLVGPSVTARLFPAVVEKSIDPFAIEAAANYPYDVPNVSVEYLRHEIGINVGYMRSVSHALNCFVAESFMDELAASARRDPVEFRRALLSKQPRYLKALELAAQEARYGAAPKGRFHGVAVMSGYDTYMAQVAEISLENGKVRVHRIVCAVDCGQVVNRDIVVAQVESGIIFGLSSTLWGEINIQRGRVQQTNFDTYRVLRINEIPRIDVLLLDNRAPPGGIGEPSTALVAPAVCIT
ncbi:MAG: aldehyde oxidase [Gammaproteobacteria bacterium]|nr:MAG: aldehyde oxidase [Gammaproteobacteria bacterium]